MTNWKVYRGALTASLFAVGLWRNNRKKGVEPMVPLGQGLHGRGLGFAAGAGDNWVSCRISTMPTTPFIGVRIS